MSQIDDAFFFAETLSPEDRLQLIAQLWASLPPEHWAAPSAAELIDLQRRLAEHDAGRADMPWEIVNRMLINHETRQRGRIYAAPRHFDLATIFVVVTAYSLLLALTTSFWPASSVPVAVFVSLVGLGQALLFRGQRPRLASVLTGMVCMAVLLVAIWFFYDRIVPAEAAFLLLVQGIIGGALLGYLAGALVGGVFLVADMLRRRFSRDSGGMTRTPAIACATPPPNRQPDNRAPSIP